MPRRQMEKDIHARNSIGFLCTFLLKPRFVQNSGSCLTVGCDKTLKEIMMPTWNVGKQRELGTLEETTIQLRKGVLKTG